MCPFGKITVILILLIATIPAAFSQLRMHSPYEQDRINPIQTGFTLQDANTAAFTWASEWTEMTAQSCTDEVAMFVWRFKDGTKAYARQGELVGDFGKNAGYLIAQKSTDLADANNKKIQPLTKTNYPTKVELWIGEAGGSTGFSPKALVDYLCFGAANIEYNHPYYFSDCPETSGN